MPVLAPALALAVNSLRRSGALGKNPIISPVAAVSVGLVDGEAMLDLDYEADHRADVDMNVAMNARGEFIEVQASAEGGRLSRAHLSKLEDLAAAGIRKLLAVQKKALS